MRLPFQRWPGHALSLPLGLALSLQAPLAAALTRPYRSRRAVARPIVARVAVALPTRPSHVATAGGDATQPCWRALPAPVAVMGRLFLTAKRSPPPPPRRPGQRGAPRKKGEVIGSPKTWATPSAAWHPHPQAAGALLQSWVGLWHRVFPGQLLRVVVVWRPHLAASPRPEGPTACGRLKPWKAFCSPEVPAAPHTLVETSADRWAMDIALRDSHADDGVAPDQCRTFAPILGAHTLRVLMAAARTLWCMLTSEPPPALSLRWRPWDRHKGAPSQGDVMWACRESLQEEGIFPIPRFCTTVAENQPEIDTSAPMAA